MRGLRSFSIMVKSVTHNGGWTWIPFQTWAVLNPNRKIRNKWRGCGPDHHQPSPAPYLHKRECISLPGLWFYVWNILAWTLHPLNFVGCKSKTFKSHRTWPAKTSHVKRQEVHQTGKFLLRKLWLFTAKCHNPSQTIPQDLEWCVFILL